MTAPMTAPAGSADFRRAFRSDAEVLERQRVGVLGLL